eukprot:GHVU01058932.1.p1 GENE.GHVU01058932.1~~GHVU01058932.1.p1  ORF type:complete len:130 (+),score=24.74 GHVU01058932.1:1082-1471(+)
MNYYNQLKDFYDKKKINPGGISGGRNIANYFRTWADNNKIKYVKTDIPSEDEKLTTEVFSFSKDVKQFKSPKATAVIFQEMRNASQPSDDLGHVLISAVEKYNNKEEEKKKIGILRSECLTVAAGCTFG